MYSSLFASIGKLLCRCADTGTERKEEDDGETAVSCRGCRNLHCRSVAVAVKASSERCLLLYQDVISSVEYFILEEAIGERRVEVATVCATVGVYLAFFPGDCLSVVASFDVL